MAKKKTTNPKKTPLPNKKHCVGTFYKGSKKDLNSSMAQQKINIKNKRARFEYDILEQYTAGIQLSGTEIKSVRESKARITESFCEFDERGSLFVINMQIDPYGFGGRFNHTPKAPRRLLLTKRELKKLHKEINIKGLTIVPLKLFLTSKGWAKLEIALCRGKKLHDKRQQLKEKDIQRSIERMKKKQV